MGDWNSLRGSCRTRKMLLAVLLVLSCTKGASSYCSSSSEIQCVSSDKCINRSYLCDGKSDCPAGEDEARSWCDYYYNSRSGCGRDQTRCNYQCQAWTTACSNGAACQDHNATICDAIVTSRKLPESVLSVPEPQYPELDPEAVATYLSLANCSIAESNSSGCPKLYTAIDGTCVAFLPFHVTFAEAREACMTISGHLLETHDATIFRHIVQHLVAKDYSSDFWTGGSFDEQKKTWVWTKGSDMPRSTPFWVMKYSNECKTRRSNSLGDHEGCYKYHQAPAENVLGHCAAMRFKYMYYFSDELCTDKMKPMCVHN